MSYQKVIIEGNLGKDPELKTVADGKEVCKFSVAVTEKWSTGESTEWFNVDDWGKSAQNHVKYLAKGSKVLVEGTFKSTEKDGKRYYTLNAQRVVYLNSRPQAQDAPPAGMKSSVSDGGLDDIPF